MMGVSRFAQIFAFFCLWQASTPGKSAWIGRRCTSSVYKDRIDLSLGESNCFPWRFLGPVWWNFGALQAKIYIQRKMSSDQL